MDNQFSSSMFHKLEKFAGGDNFATWQIVTRLQLMREGTWGIVSGAQAAPSSSATQAQTDTFRVNHDKALGLIGLGLATHLVHHIDFTITAHENWDKLEKMFGNKINNSEVFIKQKFFGLKMDESTPLTEHLSILANLIHQLDSLSVSPSENDKKAVLLSNIVSIQKYQEVLVALRVNRSTSYNDMVALLLEEDRRLKDQSDPDIAFDHAMLHQHRYRKPTSSSASSSSRPSSSSPRPSSPRPSSSKRPPPTCNFCKRLGHVEQRCFAKLAKLQEKDHANLLLLHDYEEEWSPPTASSDPEVTFLVEEEYAN